MKVSDAFPSKYLKASDIGEHTPIVTISRVVIESLGIEDEKEDKMVVYFEGKDKGLVCNKTNCNTIAGLFGDETDDWVGKKVKLMAAEVAYKGKMTLSIRVSSIKVVQGKSSSVTAPVSAKEPVAAKTQNQSPDDPIEEDGIPF